MIQIFQVDGLDISVEIENRRITLSIAESGDGFDELKVYYDSKAVDGPLKDQPYLALHVEGGEDES